MNANNLIWIDLEMTGLDTTKHHILEIATLITNSELEIIAEGPVFAIYQEEEVLSEMDEWNVRQHTGSGLIERVRKSTIREAEAEAATLAFLYNYAEPQKSPMCGNSICQDRRFLHRFMPTLEAYFHYRHLDVSSIKELATRWAPAIAKGYKKESKHLALSDIQDSIKELQYYRENLFKKFDKE